MPSKGSAGQRVRSTSAELWNSMVSAGEAYRDGRLQQAPQPLKEFRSPHLFPVRNTTGAARRAGEVVGLGSLVTTNFDIDAFSLSGIATSRGRRYAVLMAAAANNDIVMAQYRGVCRARVNVTNNQHRCARIPSDGSFVLQSCFFGPVDLLWCPSATGVDDCLVCLKDDDLPIFRTPSGGIPARSGTTAGVANCTPFSINDAGTYVEILGPNGSSQTVPVHNMAAAAVGSLVYIQCKPVFGMIVVDWEEC